LAGGIREIEFIVQSMQLVRAEATALQNASLLEVLPMLAGRSSCRRDIAEIEGRFIWCLRKAGEALQHDPR